MKIKRKVFKLEIIELLIKIGFKLLAVFTIPPLLFSLLNFLINGKKMTSWTSQFVSTIILMFSVSIVFASAFYYVEQKTTYAFILFIIGLGLIIIGNIIRRTYNKEKEWLDRVESATHSSEFDDKK